MTTRLRLLQGATALLYMGPLFAGMAGHGWAMALVFGAIFTLWSVILRPHLWPAPDQFRRPEALVALSALVATQVLLVVVCFALGRGFGGVMGLQPDLPYWLPAAISFLSVPLSRLTWPEPRPDFDPLAHRPTQTEGPEPLITALSRLPITATELELQAHLMAAHAEPWALREALAAAQGPIFARARVIQATDPEKAFLFSGTRDAATHFPPDPADMGLYAKRALHLLERDPSLAADFPTPAALRAALAQDPAAPAALTRLATLIENLWQPA